MVNGSTVVYDSPVSALDMGGSHFPRRESVEGGRVYYMRLMYDRVIYFCGCGAVWMVGSDEILEAAC